jgi:beta-mannosidase
MLRPAPLFFIAWFILAAVTRADLPETRSLGGAWEVCSNDDPEHPIPATVPGCIHTDLRAAGKIPDPFYRDNENKLQWIGDKAWTYRRSFDVPAAFLTHEFVLLRCEGLDTIATVRVNGLQIARTDNMFRTYEFDMRQALHPGANTLEITFDATAPFIHPKDVQPAFPGLGGDFIRKEPCNYGWASGNRSRSWVTTTRAGRAF